MIPDPQDTIVALSSAPGAGGRAIVRLSGPDALRCAATRFTAADPLTLPSPPSSGGEGRVRRVGSWVVDTPGIRQFQLWDMMPEEVEGFFPEFRPYVPLCAYPDCTHTHEDRCAVKRAVERRQLSARRYTSYLGLFAGESWD